MEAASLKVLIFDFFGVLALYDDQLIYDRITSYCRRNSDVALLMRGSEVEQALMTGQKDLVALHQYLADQLGLSLDYPSFQKLWMAPFSRPMPGMNELIGMLAPQAKLVLLSNTDRDYWMTIPSRHPELDLFSHVLLSYELGLAKPDPEAFLYACSIAGEQPEACLFIDDRPGNIAAASTLGLQVHLFEDVGTLQKDLGARGMLRSEVIEEYFRD